MLQMSKNTNIIKADKTAYGIVNTVTCQILSHKRCAALFHVTEKSFIKAVQVYSFFKKKHFKKYKMNALHIN